ncbi:hypothetical protein [uncultured Algibacter sp.]|uniref:hypothetical protein n=1 Tax=uncultured Algibacter sp. TaxID=298659 RepID=UPI0026174836|nr:hypothetical protein [uncultured Algibacter sp.]
MKKFIEMCGRHPFATGLFALLGIAGLYLSIHGFMVDRAESKQTTEDIISISDSLSKLNENVILSDPELKDKKIKVPIYFDMPNSYIDNIVFNASLIDINKEMTYQEAESTMHNIMDTKDYSTSNPLYAFSVSSIANKNFVQIAPYLLIDVFKVEKISEQLAGFYFGERGGSAVLREFNGTLFPKEGIHIAPMINSMKGGYVENVDYISLEPGEIEEFLLQLNFLPNYYYDFKIGIQIKFNGVSSIYWHTEKFHRGVPMDKIPMIGFGDKKFKTKYHPDIEWEVSSNENMKHLIERIKKDNIAYRRSRVFNLSMVDIDGPVEIDK